MKRISELTEQEILALVPEEVTLMINLKKAEEGIKLISKPQPPEYFIIAQPDKTVYSCSLFGDTLTFENIEHLNYVLNAIKKTDSKYKLDYDWQRLSSDFKFASIELEKQSNKEWFATTSQQVYSLELYNQIADLAMQNKKKKSEYEKELKVYESELKGAKWIEDEINDKINEVRSKYSRLNLLCSKFEFDYLPLSSGNEDIAMNFLNKAYSLSTEDIEYVLANYSKNK